MTAIVRHAPSIPDRPEYIRRTVTGTPAEVSAVIERVRAGGYLLAESMPRQIHGDHRRVQVIVTLNHVPTRPPVVWVPPSLARRAAKPLAIVGGSLAVLTALGFGLYLLIQQTVKAAAAASPIAIAVIVFAGVLLLGGLAKRKAGSSCSGIHCGGCGGH